jgi:hypothetical protein
MWLLIESLMVGFVLVAIALTFCADGGTHDHRPKP